MIYTDRVVRASGPSTAQLAAIGMAPAKQEIAIGRPFVGPSGKLFDQALATNKMGRASVYVTNLCQFYIDDNDLYSVPEEIMARERERVFQELERIRPNCLLIMGGDTLDLLTASRLESYVPKTGKYAGKPRLKTIGGKQGVVKWRGSIISITLPSGRLQKCVIAMHPANFLRGQWKWLPLFKYIDVKRAVQQSAFAQVELTERKTIVPGRAQMAIDYLKALEEQEWVAIDYEGRRHITVLGAGCSPNEAISVPLSRVGSSTFWPPEEECAIWKAWTSLLENQKVRKIAQNAAYEWIKSWLYGIYPTNLGIDTMHAHHCLYPDFGGINDEWQRGKRDIDNPGHGLALICSQYTDQPFYKDEGRHWTPELGEYKFWEYNGTDVMVTYEAGRKMHQELQQLGLWETYQEQYLGVFEKCIQMEWIGIKQDLAKRAAVRLSVQDEIVSILEQLSEATGLRVITKTEKKGQKPQPGILNLGSTRQFGAWMKERGYKPVHKFDKKSGKTKESFDKDAMASLVIKNPSDIALRLIVEVNKKQDFIDKVLNVKIDEAGYMHCHWKLGGTNGTRWSSAESILDSGSNLQNLPRTGVARSFFLPD